MKAIHNYNHFQTVCWLVKPQPAHKAMFTHIQKQGFLLQTATSAEEWLTKIHPKLPGIFLLEIKTAEQASSEIIRKLHSTCLEKANFSPSIFGIFNTNNCSLKEHFIASGGTACLTDPFGEQEVIALLKFHSQTLKAIHEAQAQKNENSQVVTIAMENSSDLGSIINFIKKAIGAKHYSDLAQLLFRAVELHCDNCLIEIKGHARHYYFSAQKQDNKLIESSLDNDMQHYLLNQKEAGRIVKLDHILQINQSNLSILLDGVPTHDLTRMERISDSFVILSDVANRFTQSLSIEENLQITETERRAFLNTLSHELRTPLNGVIGFSKTLRSKRTDLPLGEGGISALGKIIEGTEQINAIISTLIEISIFDTSVNENEKIDIDGLLIRIKSKFLALAKAKDLEFTINAPNGLNVFSNSSKLFNILSRLIDNAIKFTDNGKVLIEASIDSDLKMGQHLIFKISDTGIGIDPKDHTKIFTEIGQLNTEHNRRHYGIGLGLYYSHLITQQLGGELTLQSSLGNGASFYLKLPLTGNTPSLTHLANESASPTNTNDHVLF